MTINILTTSVSSEKRIIAGHQKNKEKNYWLKKLSGNLQASRIFYDFDLKSTGEKQLPGDKDHIRLEIPQILCAKLLSAAKGSDYALHVILAAGLILLLDRYTYSDDKDFIIGSPIYRQEIEGEFINTLLPLRIRMNTGMTFKKLLAKVKQTVVEAVEHQNYPLDLLIPEPDLAFSLFDIAILLENLHDREYLQGINPGMIISFKRSGQALEGEIEYNALRYRKETIERTGRHFTRLLYEALTHADMELSAVDMLSADEKKQLLTDFNDTRSPYPESQTIPRLFAEQVKKSPHKIAVVYQDYYVTYRELDNRADGLARHLKTGGLVPDTPVGLMVERSIDMIVDILGILKAGGAYLPIDPEFPLKRILSMLEDSQVSLLVTGQHVFENNKFTILQDHHVKKVEPFLTASRPPAIIIPDAPDWIEPKKDDPGEHTRDQHQGDITRPTNLAYVMYTSGSTGKPKGVMVEHKNVARLVKNTNYIDLQENDRLLLTGAFAFDITTFEFWAPLLNGLSLYLVDKNIVLDAKKMRKAIAKNDISILHLIPQLFNQLLTQEPGIFARLRYFLVGGDMVSPGYINRLRKKYGDLRILHMYGPTENTTFSTFLPIHKDYGANIPIGKPISNTTVYIVDKSDRLQSLGVPGELWVGGHGIARGYLNRPELTAKQFCPWRPGDSLFEGTRGQAPLSLKEKKGKDLKQSYMSYRSHRSYFYRTGDLARWLPGGNIEFLGRIDQQLKISGIRIELGEIENILRRNQALEDCVVVSRKINGENQVIAYYKKKNQVELWPSMAEYFAYDDLLYHAIANDESRNEKYRNAIQKAVKDKVVLEIGPGNDAILSRMCVEAGAKKVYAVEILDQAYQKAKETIKNLNLEHKIILMHGDINRTKLTEKVDYCVSEIVGCIGGSEGAAKLINALHQANQLKNPPGMIPSRSVTKIAAITLPADEFEATFEEVGGYYVEHVFAHVGRKFDLRLCLLSFPPGNLISNEDIFEELDFTRENQLEEEHDIYLEITRHSIFHGFIAWLVLYCDEQEVIDTLAKRYIWLPIYFPVFSGGQPVKKGDYIKTKITRKLSDNNLNPDFTIEGFLYKKQENQSLDFIFHSPHLAAEFKANPFYKRLFSMEKVKITRKITPTVIREFLAAELPEYMLPQYIIELEDIPLTATGKIDRGALPSPELLKEKPDLVGPRNEIEHKIMETVKQVLNREDVGIFNNFFEMGGNSLKAMELVSKLSEEFDITINHLFQYGTIAGIAENITWQKDTLKERIQEIKQRLATVPTADEIAANQKGLQEAEQEYQQYLERVEREKLPCLTTEQDYSHILITGSTGYMGAHLLYELIKETKAVLHLPVRGSSPANARERLEEKLTFYFGKSFFAENQERLQVVCGDLRKEKLGIEDPLYEKLTEITDAVIHAAANVRFYGFYKDFYRDNVESTQKLLEFSLTGNKKNFHHISTPGVGNGNVKGKKYIHFSEYCYNVGQIFDNVYDQTKLEAEELVLAYRDRGIDARIYRVGSLLCHSVTGKFQENIEDSGFYSRLKAYITLGGVPELNIMNYDMTFVDQVAKAVIMLLKRKNLSNQTYHIFNPHILPWHQMVPFFNQCQLNVKVVKPVEFLDYLSECIEKDIHRELIDRLLLHSGLLNRELAEWITITRYAANRTIGILEKIGFQWEKPNEHNIKKMIEYCQQIGFIPINQRSRENKNKKTK